MSKITAANILKIVDVENSQLSAETKKYFQFEAAETYRDQVLKEHIYSIETLLDDYEENEDENAEILQQLEEIKSLCTKKNAGYVRIIFSN